MSDAPTDDPAITITLPLSQLNIVTDHLRKGICGDTFDVLLLIYFQSDNQLLEAARLQRIALEQAGLSEIAGVSTDSTGADRDMKVH